MIGGTSSTEVTALAPDRARLAQRLCDRLGMEKDGPVGRRFLAACASLSQTLVDSLTTAGTSVMDTLLSQTIDEAINRETYFFRDRRQLTELQKWLPRRAQSSQGAPLRLWSAGCASGEEPYSIAILSRQLPGSGVRIELLGTDVAQAALRIAEAGLYRTGPMSPCRDLQPADESFLPLAGADSRQVAPALRSMVRFRQHNLMDLPPEPGVWDAVICRNVLIYMTESARRRAMDNLAGGVAPGGLLILGPGDVSTEADPLKLGFEPVFDGGATLYRRRGVHGE
jgi:chemotaxis protein methyltransferase CheR